MKDLDLQPEREVSLVELAVGQWVYLMRFAETTRDSYRKLLVQPSFFAPKLKGSFCR